MFVIEIKSGNNGIITKPCLGVSLFIPFWQIVPVNPGLQTHWELPMRSRQVPPFRQGCRAHSSISEYWNRHIEGLGSGNFKKRWVVLKTFRRSTNVIHTNYFLYKQTVLIYGSFLQHHCSNINQTVWCLYTCSHLHAL